MRLPMFVLAVLCCLVPQAAFAAPTAAEWARVINISGRQRMLTQKMSKEALFITSGVDVDRLREDLAKTTSLFETSLAGLRDGSESLGLPATENPRIVKQLDKVNAMYLELKPMLESVAHGGVLSAAQAQKLAELNLPLLKAMNKAVKMYERGAKKVLSGDAQSAVVINLAGKQRMLTQKMTKESLLVLQDIDRDSNRLNLRETASLFDRTLVGLIQGDENLGLPGTENEAIREQLEKVSGLWHEVQALLAPAIDGEELSPAALTELATVNVHLLREMNRGVKMFEEASH